MGENGVSERELRKIAQLEAQAAKSTKKIKPPPKQKKQPDQTEKQRNKPPKQLNKAVIPHEQPLDAPPPTVVEQNYVATNSKPAQVPISRMQLLFILDDIPPCFLSPIKLPVYSDLTVTNGINDEQAQVQAVVPEREPDSQLNTRSEIPLHSFETGQEVVVRESDGIWYNAEVLKSAPSRVFIHFRGWNQRYDRWVNFPCEDIRNKPKVGRGRPLKGLEAASVNRASNPKENYALENEALGDGRLFLTRNLLRKLSEIAQESSFERRVPQYRRKHRIQSSSDDSDSEDSNEDFRPQIESRGGNPKLSRKEARRIRHEEEALLRQRQQDELDASAWYRCDNCHHGIHNMRYSCRYCEQADSLFATYDLCTECFQLNFPHHHPHPQTSFAIAVIHEDLKNADDKLRPDVFLTNYEQYKSTKIDVLSQFKDRPEKVCALCDEEENDEIGPFINKIPFANPFSRTSYFWIHRSCALASPEVLCRNDQIWFNVALAVKRGRRIKCATCGQKGATIGCMDIRCNKSFHLRCSGRQPNSFADGAIFWCLQHDQARVKASYNYVINCDGCGEKLKGTWRSCTECESYWNGYDLCMDCFERLPKVQNFVRGDLADISEQISVMNNLDEIDVVDVSMAASAEDEQISTFMDYDLPASPKQQTQQLFSFSREILIEQVPGFSLVDPSYNEESEEEQTDQPSPLYDLSSSRIEIDLSAGDDLSLSQNTSLSLSVSDTSQSTIAEEGSAEQDQPDIADPVDKQPSQQDEEELEILRRKRSGRLRHRHDRDAFALVDHDAFMPVDHEPNEESSLDAPRRKRRRRAFRIASLQPEQFCCFYCSNTDCTDWRQGFWGVIMCSECARLSTSQLTAVEQQAMEEDTPESELLKELETPASEYIGAIEDYAHQPYLTRRVFSSIKDVEPILPRRPLYLSSYEPQEDQQFSLGINTTFFDIPGRAPRWASHSASDYSGTWLPQIVRWSLQRFTAVGDRVLSNFLGRGTDVIESFLLGRPAIGIDINPLSVALSQRNCTFAVPPPLQQVMRAERRPTLVMADATQLKGPLFRSASFDHVLSHPPYYRCIVYSTHLDGDLSRCNDVNVFAGQMLRVAQETKRLLKVGKRCTLGIGDNREHCFIIPVAFITIMEYINSGLVIEQIVLKRQRCCAGTAKGASLSLIHDFLIITHEFIVIFRNQPDQDDVCSCRFDANSLKLPQQAPPQQDSSTFKRSVEKIPTIPFASQYKVLGTVWCFVASTLSLLVDKTCHQILERFGVPEASWERLSWSSSHPAPTPPTLPTTTTTKDFPQIDQVNEDDDNTEFDPEDASLSQYERQRNKRVADNNRLMRALGLLTTDSAMAGSEDKPFENIDVLTELLQPPHEETLPPPLEASVTTNKPKHAIVCLSFIEPVSLANINEVSTWRSCVIEQATESSRHLNLGGVLVVGARDHYFPCSHRQHHDEQQQQEDETVFWPLTLIIWKDLQQMLPSCMTLKEIVAVAPKNFSKNRDDKYAGPECYTSDDEIKPLPIVHDLYLIFIKRRRS